MARRGSHPKWNIAAMVEKRLTFRTSAGAFPQNKQEFWGAFHADQTLTTYARGTG
jgi:hypothetical protein